MIENHIKISDLVVKEPRLGKEEYIFTEENLNNHIIDAYRRVCIELGKRNIDTRLVMIPIVLYNSEITSMNLTTNWVKAQKKNRVKRIVIKTDAPAPSSNLKLYLEGSNDSGVTNSPLVTLDVNEKYASAIFTEEYKHYRVRLTAESNPNIHAYIYLCETSFDDLIIYKSLENFFIAKYRTDDDQFASKRLLYQNKFDTEIDNLVYAYDINDNGLIDDDEQSKNIIVRVAL